MSDGNFNRALLPSTPYHSGLQAGRTQMRMKAQEAFKCIISEHFPTLSEKKSEELQTEFLAKLR